MYEQYLLSSAFDDFAKRYDTAQTAKQPQASGLFLSLYYYVH